MSLDWLLDDTFSNLDRGFLIERQTRQKLVDYFNTNIEEFRLRNDSNGQKECGQIVLAAIKFHKKSKSSNSGVCLFGKYHNILYVVAKLCFGWKFDDTEIISKLLIDIYECECTFEKFFECSIFGTKVTQLISGWRSDYYTQEENINASLYFLNHAIKKRLTFVYNDSIRNFIDIPMNCYENISPLKAAVNAEKWDLVALLIKYGAVAYLPFSDADYENYAIFQLFVEKLEKYDKYGYNCKSKIIGSFKIFMRSIPSLSVVWKFENEKEEERVRIVLLIFLNELDLNDSEEPRSLKHLARCATRLHFAQNHLLPVKSNGELFIPESLEKYLNLETD